MPFGIAANLRILSHQLNSKLVVKIIPSLEYRNYRNDKKEIRRKLQCKSGRQWIKLRKKLNKTSNGR